MLRAPHLPLVLGEVGILPGWVPESCAQANSQSQPAALESSTPPNPERTYSFLRTPENSRQSSSSPHHPPPATSPYRPSSPSRSRPPSSCHTSSRAPKPRCPNIQ